MLGMTEHFILDMRWPETTHANSIINCCRKPLLFVIIAQKNISHLELMNSLEKQLESAYERKRYKNQYLVTVPSQQDRLKYGASLYE